MKETQVRSLGWEYSLEEKMVTHSSILAWWIPWTKDPGRLQLMGSQSWAWLKWLSRAQSTEHIFLLQCCGGRWKKLVEVMAFQLTYFKSWKMMMWKFCSLYASKFGEFSSGHRIGKSQFSFQSQRQAMPKNVQTAEHLHLSCMLAK